ncbi:MAG: hypothetical protein R2851_02135 [Caldilineaceae bacterium]
MAVQLPSPAAPRSTRSPSMAARFMEAGFQGDITVEARAPRPAGGALCRQNHRRANASHTISRQETAACQKTRRTPVKRGTDALAVVVSSQNDFHRRDAGPVAGHLSPALSAGPRWTRPGPTRPSCATCRAWRAAPSTSSWNRSTPT